jgi:hypothetical protein
MGNGILHFLINWWPLLLMIAIWLVFMGKTGALNYKGHIQRIEQIASEQTEQMKITNQYLMDIKELLEKPNNEQ